MSDMLEQCKEVEEQMTRKVETNMGMVGDNLEQVGNNLEEAWGNLVEWHFSGDDAAALQVNFPNPQLLKPVHSPPHYPHHYHPQCSAL